MKNNANNETELLEHRLNLTVRFTQSELDALEKTIHRYGFMSRGQAVRFMMFNSRNAHGNACGKEHFFEKIEQLENTKIHAEKLLSLTEKKLNSDKDSTRQTLLVFARLADSLREISSVLQDLKPIKYQQEPKAKEKPPIVKKRDYQKVDIHGTLVNNVTSLAGANGNPVSAFRVKCTRKGSIDNAHTVYDVYKAATEDDVHLVKGTVVQVAGDLDIRPGRIIIIATRTLIVKNGR